MKNISEHLGEIIIALAAICLLVCAVVVFKAPLGGFFSNIVAKETGIAENVLQEMQGIGSFAPNGGSGENGGNGGAGGSGGTGSVDSGVYDNIWPIEWTDSVVASNSAKMNLAAIGNVTLIKISNLKPSLDELADVSAELTYTTGDDIYTLEAFGLSEPEEFDKGNALVSLLMVGDDYYYLYVVSCTSTGYSEEMSTSIPETGIYYGFFDNNFQDYFEDGVEFNFVLRYNGEGSGNSGEDNSDEEEEPEDKIVAPSCGNVIPEGGIYTSAVGTVHEAGEIFPDLRVGDMYTYGDYTYKYNYYTAGNGSWYEDSTLNGWGVDTIDNTKNTYGNILESINGYPISSLSFTYSDCSNLTSVNLSYLDTSNVTRMNSMFRGCSSLSSADLSGLDTNNVKTTATMFYGCSNLNNLNLSGFDTGNVTDMASMFCNCKALETLDLSSFDTKKVTNMANMFNSCQNIKTLNLSNFNTMNVKTMEKMFYQCCLATNIDVSGFDTRNVTTMESMFYSCYNLTTLNVLGFNTSNVESMENMFTMCYGLGSLNVSNFNTSNVETMYGMFDRCSGLTTLDLSNFDTSSVWDMGCMFDRCSNLTSLNLSGWDTRGVSSMFQMFSGCKSLEVLDISDFNTSNVTRMYCMFSSCSDLLAIYVGEGWDTSKVSSNDIKYMFNNCGVSSVTLKE